MRSLSRTLTIRFRQAFFREHSQMVARSWDDRDPSDHPCHRPPNTHLKLRSNFPRLLPGSGCCCCNLPSDYRNRPQLIELSFQHDHDPHLHRSPHTRPCYP